MARGLLKAGAKVCVWGRSEERNRTATAELSHFGEVASVACDVSDEASVRTALDDTLKRFERVDSCFANAGIHETQTPFLDMTVEQWNRILSVNLTGTFITLREIAKHMVSRGGGGKLVVTASIGATFGIPQGEHYSASKAAVCALVRSLAVELGKHNIQANAVLPGWIDTDMTTKAKGHAKMNEAILQRTPARRWGTPDDFESIAVYFASPQSNFHTGDSVTIDGGYSRF